MRTEYRKQKAKAKFIKYLRRTWKNKLAAIAMIMIGMLGVVVCNDATALVVLACIAVPMFFTKKDCYN